MNAPLPATLYLIAAICFILSLKGLASPATARRGNYFGIAGMAIAMITTMMFFMERGQLISLVTIAAGGGVGAFIAKKIKMTAMPQLVAAFHSLIGAAAVLIAASAFHAPAAFDIASQTGIKTGNLIELAIGAMIGAITFSGSIVAFFKLQGLVSGRPMVFKGQHLINLGLALVMLYIAIAVIRGEAVSDFWLMVILAMVLGLTLIMPIGGADMPVIISMLNSYSGWAAAGIGFSLGNTLLVITGALVGASGAILSYIMCRGMNRSFLNVILGGFGTTEESTLATKAFDQDIKSGSGEDAACILSQAKEVVIVPGYGMAVAQAQHVLKEMVDLLQKKGVNVRFAIHPVAGRMPGHMNVLLAEANVPYDLVYELEEINRDFANTDVSFVIGANDITNPAAKTDTSSPIYGMPVLDVEKSKNVLFVKRSLSPGYAGIQNTLFANENTMMLFGDAKEMVESIIKSLED